MLLFSINDTIHLHKRHYSLLYSKPEACRGFRARSIALLCRGERSHQNPAGHTSMITRNVSARCSSSKGSVQIPVASRDTARDGKQYNTNHDIICSVI